MPNTRVEIPEISNRRLGYLARIIRPVIGLQRLPLGKYPHDNTEMYFLTMPKDLRENNFLRERAKGKPILLVKEYEVETLHLPGSAGRVFHPTIAEVLAQIPTDWLGRDVPSGCRIVAFETYLEERDPKYDKTGRFHVARTVLLIKGSPYSGDLVRAHHTG